jgi:NAD(P)-dependent dehydrogenase (short-subunit alcohol dehydrogenase family)
VNLSSYCAVTIGSPNLSLISIIELHVLVNNSGSNWGAPYDEYPPSAWTRVLTLNLHRVFLITQLLTPLLEKGASPGDPSRIINIGSVDGLRVPQLETFAYSASKAGLHHLSRVLASHLGKRNVTFVPRFAFLRVPLANPASSVADPTRLLAVRLKVK